MLRGYERSFYQGRAGQNAQTEACRLSVKNGCRNPVTAI
jgi:hypothetical protein